MLMIRFQRIGRTNQAAFRMVVLEKERAAKTGRITDRLGSYNPHTKALSIDEARLKDWIAKGAQPTDTVRNLLITKGILQGKKVNVIAERILAKKEEVVAEAAAPVAAAPAAEVAEAASEAPAAEVAEAPAA